VIAVRPDAGNRQLVDALGGAQASELTFLERTELHAKGLVGDRYSLVGSMNFTFNGLERLTEMLIFQTDPSAVEQLRLAFRDEYGGIS
jgi:phosphatidylserine/phosphatidylglycerophosphate/cardiolipin synthase-like enzyme